MEYFRSEKSRSGVFDSDACGIAGLLGFSKSGVRFIVGITGALGHGVWVIDRYLIS